MSFLRVISLAAALALAATEAAAAPVLMISIDGLRPGDVQDAGARGLKLPVLRGLAAGGVSASGVRAALPTLTYPNHTTLITGVWPARHGIAGNTVFDPTGENQGGWYWYARDIRVRTLWDAVHQSGGKVASLAWPVSVGTAAIDYNIPEYWRARNAEDTKLLRALSSPGLVSELEHRTGIPLAQANGDGVDADLDRMRYAAAILAARRPQLTTLHLRAFDHIEHVFGPGSPEANAALEELDAGIGALIMAARKTQPDLVVAIVSDHGFTPLAHSVNLIAPFAHAGLITRDASNQVVSWKAMPWPGSSAPVILANPGDAALKAKVGQLLDRLMKRPELGIARVIDAAEIARMGGAPTASYWIDFKPGYAMGGNPSKPAVSPSPMKGDHGYFPTHPEMRATFILEGPGIAPKTLGEIDMRDIAPTLAKVMAVPFPGADGKPLF